MSTNDNKELQTELEITGGIITFAIIIIGVITLVTICAHLEKKKKFGQQPKIRTRPLPIVNSNQLYLGPNLNNIKKTGIF